MKKLFSILIALVMVFSVVFVLTACNPEVEIYMITDIGEIDDKSFNEGTWAGVKEWANRNGIGCAYLKPTSSEEADLISAMNLAITGGAKVIVAPGFVFNGPVQTVARANPNVKFVILDTNLSDANWNEEFIDNVATFTYDAEYSGYLAGYAAVKEGFTKLAYLGGINYSSVYCFGIGFVQGAEKAATEMSKAAGSIEVKWDYTGDFAASATTKTKAAGWFTSGTQVLFSVGGANQLSCFAAAEEAGAGKWVISPDTDGTSLSTKCLTSALKELAKTVIVALNDIYDNNGVTYLGSNTIMSLNNGMVGLADNFTRFTTFTEADYNTIVGKLIAKTAVCKLVSDAGVEDFNTSNVAALSSVLSLSKVVVTAYNIA